MKDIPLKCFVLFKKMGTAKWFVKVFCDEFKAEGYLSIPDIQVNLFLWALITFCYQIILDAMQNQEEVDITTEMVEATEVDQRYNGGAKQKLVITEIKKPSN